MIETDRRITAAGPRIFMQAAKSFDVLILGGGPGGAAAAITLARQGVAVAVIERSSGSGWRCGEILSPEGIGCLRRLRAFDEFVTGPHIPCPGVVTVWENAEAQMQDAIWSPQGRSWVLDRREFDASLANSARQAGACWIDAAAPTVLRRCSQQRWALTIKQRGVNQTLSGRLLIDSTGRAAWGARRLGIERVATDQLTALLAICSSTVTDQRLLLEATTDGWWYCIRLPTGRLLAA